MRIRHALLVVVLSFAAAIGCTRGNGGPPPPTEPTPSPTPPVTDSKPPEPELEPEIEPVPGEAVRLTLPRDGGVWPWSVGHASQSPASQPLTFRNLAALAVTGFAVRPEVDRAVVSIRFDPPKKGPAPPKGLPAVSTRVILCDTATGRATTEWLVPGLYTVLDLSPDGRSILATYSQSGRTRLRLWVIGSDGQLKRWSWAPHLPVREGTLLLNPAYGEEGTEVRWAAFAGVDRVVSYSRAGQIRVFDTDGLKPLATMDASPCRPGLSADGTKVAFMFGTSVALLDTQSLKLVGTRWVGPAPLHPVLAFCPDGTRLAIGGNGRLVLLNLTSGDLQSISLPKLDVNDNGVYDKAFGWAGASQLLAEGNLFDPELPKPVWEYGSTRFIQFSGWQVWASTSQRGGSTVTIRAFTLPMNDAAAALAAAKAEPGAFAMKPGSAINIDVSGLPEARRSEALGVLEKRLREIGFVVDPKAAATLIASVDSPGTKRNVYYSGFNTNSYLRKPARLRIVLDGTELWNEAWAVEPPLFANLPRGSGLSNYLSKLGTGLPDFTAFASAPIPSHLPGPAAPKAVLGNTDLAPSPRPDK